MQTFDYILSDQPPVQLGLVVLQSDETIEADFRRLLPTDTECLVTRLPAAPHVSREGLAAMEGDIHAAARLFPNGAHLSCVGFGCTSGAAQIGPDRVADILQKTTGSNQITEPLSALIAACRYLGITRLGLLTPYVASVSKHLCHCLVTEGIDVTSLASFNESEEANVARISPKSITKAALEMGQNPDIDAVFLSCTNLRTLDVITPLETQLQKPVLSSNLVLAWEMLRLAEKPFAPAAPGSLWR